MIRQIEQQAKVWTPVHVTGHNGDHLTLGDGQVVVRLNGIEFQAAEVVRGPGWFVIEGHEGTCDEGYWSPEWQLLSKK